MSGWKSAKFAVIIILFQITFLVLFGVFAVYDKTADAFYDDKGKGNVVGDYYPMFQDVHVMIFIGFGFLMTFLKRYGFGAVGVNFLIAAFAIQWATLMSGFLHLGETEDGKIHLEVTTLLTSDFAAAAVLISFGAMLGKASPLQLMIMAFLEIIFFSVNEYVGLKFLKVADVGGSMFVHVFGAYFGIALARVLYSEKVEKAEEKEGSVYHSDIFAMIGTIFLWLFWPSFNSALAPGDDQHRAVINTYFALASCCVTAFAVSALVSKENKFNMVHIQNSTLAGGVAVGTCADMMIQPYGAMLIGAVAGTLSVVGYKYLQPCLANKLKLHDTCGVNNLHGMPGLLAGVAGAIAASLATKEIYGPSLCEIFSARAGGNGTVPVCELGRSAGEQGGFQALALAMTFVVAIVGGGITGLILRIPIWDNLNVTQVFDDTDFWEMPSEGVPSPDHIGENGEVMMGDKYTVTAEENSKI